VTPAAGRSPKGAFGGHEPFVDIDPWEIWARLQEAPFRPLPESTVRTLLERIEAQLFEHAPALLDVEVLVGDTHGQLADVLWLLQQHGPPSPMNIYLFNGDICDRGQHAIEIWALLFAFMLERPGTVWVLRGNHESPAMNERPRSTAPRTSAAPSSASSGGCPSSPWWPARSSWCTAASSGRPA